MGKKVDDRLARSAGFERTRSDHSRETAEDYVELILRMESSPEDGVRNVDLVRVLGVSQPTVTKALERLEREGLVEVEPRTRITLTSEGRSLAQMSLDRHQAVVDFLLYLGVPAFQAEVDAEGIEHHVSDVTLTALRAFLKGVRMREPS